MGRLWVIAKREYLERVRTKWFAVATIFGPVLFGALMILPPWIASRSRASLGLSRITILDATGTGLGKRVAAGLGGGIGGDTIASARVVEVKPDEIRAVERRASNDVIRGAANGYLVVDASTLSGVRARYAGSNATAVADMQELRRVVREQVMAIRLEQAGVDPIRTSALTRMRLTLDAERLSSRGRGGSGQISIFFALGVALLLYFSIFFYGQTVLRGVMEEKQTRVSEVVLSSVPASTLLDGKVLGVGAVGLTQILLWILASLLLIKARGTVLAWLGAPSLPLVLPNISFGLAATLLLFFLLGYVFYAALFAAIGAIVNSEQEAQQAQIPIVMMLAASIAFLQAILARPDGTLAVVLSLLPFSSPIVMPLRMSLIQVPPWEGLMSLGFLAFGCYIVVWMAARIYRVGLLMYGKRATVREIARWVRYAA
ncbi:MAG: ABC transporter permease [Gemmatimonadaceae bacterium]